MPIPAAAGLLASTIHLCYGIPVQYWWISIPWLGLVALAGFLMVSTWRFWSEQGDQLLQETIPSRCWCLVAIFIYLAVRYSNVVLFTIAVIYMFSGIWARAAYTWSRRRRRPLADPAVTPEEETETRDSVRYLEFEGCLCTRLL